MNIAFLGYPGSGKTTQALLLAPRLGLAHVSFGDIFRGEVKKKSPLGIEVSNDLQAGHLVPDWLVLTQLKERLAKAGGPFLFDGFPRTIEQEEGLETWLAGRKEKLDFAIVLKLPEAEALKRVAGRKICSDCTGIFNQATRQPFMEGLCDFCGGKLKLRDDDRPEVVKKRFLAYRDQTEQLISYYRSNAEVVEIDAMLPPSKVTERILAAVKTV